MKPFKGPRLEDLGDLQELVAQHAEALDPGLQILDTGVQLGTATVDLLALDASRRPTLVVLGFVADDDLLLRALDAYAWCQDYPEELRRLHPLLGSAAADTVRLIVIAEQVPDTFLRKARHLRLDRIDLFQFHFGLTFKPVPTTRASEPAARDAARRSDPVPPVEPPARDIVSRGTGRRADGARSPVPRLDVGRLDASRLEAPRVEPPRWEPARVDGAGSAGPRSEAARPLAVPGARTPANGRVPAAPVETPDLERPARPENSDAAPAPRGRALDTGRGTLDEWKVSVVREYLQREFPTTVIYDFYAHDRGVQLFHLQDNLGAVIHTAAVAEDLLTEFSEADLRAFLDRHKLARVLRQAGQAGVSVTRTGLKIERS